MGDSTRYVEPEPAQPPSKKNPAMEALKNMNEVVAKKSMNKRAAFEDSDDDDGSDDSEDF